MADLETNALKAEASAFLGKPYDLVPMSRKLPEMLDSPRRQAQRRSFQTTFQIGLGLVTRAIPRRPAQINCGVDWPAKGTGSGGKAQQNREPFLRMVVEIACRDSILAQTGAGKGTRLIPVFTNIFPRQHCQRKRDFYRDGIERSKQQ